jgi:NAD(P)H-nitrite reductase large subunit
MANKKHVVVGAGPAGLRAIETIRSLESDSSITLIGDEPAYSRMVLPYYLAGDIQEKAVFTGDDNYFSGLNVDTRFGARVTGIDASAKSVSLSDGSSIKYDNLLIATGSSATIPPIEGADGAGVQNMWNIDDARNFKNTVSVGSRVVIVGAGFIGLIILDGLHGGGHTITFVELEDHILPRMINSEAAEVVEAWLEKNGVRCITGTSVSSIGQHDSHRDVKLSNGDKMESDAVVMATGIRPNLDFASSAGIATGDGILVDGKMATNVAGVYAAGDVAEGPVLHSDSKAVHAIQPTAFEHGRVAGSNMAGHEVDYAGSIGFNVVDAVGLQVASFGDWQSDADTTVVSSKITSVYRRLSWDGDRIVGAVMVGRASDVGALNDVGMVKGFIQAGTHLGKWKDYLNENPLDVRKPYIACKVAEGLLKSTLTGGESANRGYRDGNVAAKTQVSEWHGVLVEGIPQPEDSSE